jgi:hypothetical protein
VIESVIHFFKIHREMIFGNITVVVQDVLGITPETFNAVDMIFVIFVFERFIVIYLVVFA